MLCNFGGARGTAGVEIGGNAVLRFVFKGQGITGLRRHFLGKAEHFGVVVIIAFGTQKPNDPAFDRAEIARQIDLWDWMSVGTSVPDGRRDAWRNGGPFDESWQRAGSLASSDFC